MIYGKRIRLRAAEKADLEQSYEWINDPEVRAGLAAYLPQSMQDEERWLENASKHDPAEKPLAIEIREGEGWRPIGSCALFGIQWSDRSAEFGIMIGDKSVWDKGYGSEVTQLMLDHGFATLNLNRIFLRVYATNPRARRVYEKAGFVHEGTMRQAIYRNGKYVDVHFMSVLRSEWETRKERQ